MRISRTRIAVLVVAALAGCAVPALLLRHGHNRAKDRIDLIDLA